PRWCRSRGGVERAGNVRDGQPVADAGLLHFSKRCLLVTGPWEARPNGGRAAAGKGTDMSEAPQPSDGDAPVNRWARRSRAVAYQNPWITVYHDEVLRPDSRPGIYGVVHFRNRAVGVVALDGQDRVLLVGQYRYTLAQYSWEIPEGGAAEGEEPLAAARRELLEETGYSAERWELLLRAHLSNSVSDEEAFCYLATGLRPRPAAPGGAEG